MKQVFTQQCQHSRLFLFFAGWGADEGLFDYPLHPDFDYLICYDYSDLDFDLKLLNGYSDIYLFAWSMGVYAATQVFASHSQIPIRYRMAINGTIYPKDNRRGLSEQTFKRMLLAFSPSLLVWFRHQICGNTNQVKAFLSHKPYRSVESLHNELKAVNDRLQTTSLAWMPWDKAIIGQFDRIILPDCQHTAWEGTLTEELPIAHYDNDFLKQLFGNPLAFISD